MKHKIIAVFISLFLLFFGFLCCNDAKADGGGGWINPEADTGDSGGGSSGGGGSVANRSYSWIYYQSTTNNKLSGDSFMFAPDNWYISNSNSGAGNFYISTECSGKAENGQPRGFWHLGTNAELGNYKNLNQSKPSCRLFSFPYTGDSRLPYWPSIRVDATTGWACEVTRKGYNYSGEAIVGTFGHNSTRDLKVLKSGRFSGWGESAQAHVNHELYYNDTMIFKAVKSRGTERAFSDYKKAYMKIMGITDENDPSLPKGMPKNVFAFCYWDGIEEPSTHTLTAYAVDGATGDLLNDGSAIGQVTKKSGEVGSVAAINIENYIAVGYRLSQKTGSITAGKKYSVTLDSDVVVYFVYEKKYKLSIDKDDYSDVGVTRTESPYAKASIGSLDNNAAIYRGDKLSVTLGAKNCYSAVKDNYMIDGSVVGTGTFDKTVSDNVNVYARSPIIKYKLTIDQADGSVINVWRNSVASGAPDNAWSGNLSNQADIYCGDSIGASFGLNEGYEWGSHRFVGKDIDDTTSLEINPHIVGADVLVTTKDISRQNFTLSAYAFKIDNSGSFVSDLNNGNAFTSDNADYNSSASVYSSAFKPTGYTFRGWRDNKEI